MRMKRAISPPSAMLMPFDRERRVSEYEEAPSFRLGPGVVTRTQASGDGL